jgi:single-strand DNA-binding protein
MNSLRNNVHLIGHVGANPEIKTTASGKKVANFDIATTDVFYDPNGEKQTETMWHNLVAWGKTAENVEKFLSKGKEVVIQGKIANRSYTDKNGTKKYVSEILVQEMLLVGGPKKIEA